MSVTSEEGRQRRLFGKLSGSQKLSSKENRNGLTLVVALAMSKIGDGLLDPKLVLSWLLNVLGAPGYFIGALVPVREGGALLFQVVFAAILDEMPRRKWMWVAGSAVQGLAAFAIAASGYALEGWLSGLAICVALAVLAIARAGCSISFKVILGKSVSRRRRGAVTGLASSAAALAVLVFALMLISGLLQEKGIIVLAVALAGALWVLAAVIFATVHEERGRTYEASFPEFRRLWQEDWYFRQFIFVRGLLVSTALAPPYLVMLSASRGEVVLSQLGALVLASAAASFLSSYIWGRLSDWSSRRVLTLAGGLGALAMGVLPLMIYLGGDIPVLLAAAVLFVLMIAYHGVRQARSTYLVDLAPADFRAAYAAIANTIIGVILLLAGALGGVLSLVGAEAALAGFAVMSLLGGLMALRLREVEHP